MSRSSGTQISKKEIGERLRSLRRSRGVTQVELARVLRTNQSNISDIERGVRGFTVKQLTRVSMALHASADEILGLRETTENGIFNDRRFLRRLQKIETLSKRDKLALLRTIDAFLKSSRKN